MSGKLILAVFLTTMTAAAQHMEPYGWPKDHPMHNKVRFVAKDGTDIGNCDLSDKDGITLSNCVIDSSHVTDVLNIYTAGLKSERDWNARHYQQLEKAADDLAKACSPRRAK